MAHRRVHSTSQMFEAELDQQWNHLLTEDPYLHFARTVAAENDPILHPGIVESRPVERAPFASHWNPAGRLNGYSSSNQMVNVPHYQPDASDPSHDSLHASATGNVFMVPENHVRHASSSNFGDQNNFFDHSRSNQRGPYKRKNPGIPAIGERGSTSRYYCAGSSSDVSSSSEAWQEKPTVDSQFARWERSNVPPLFRGNQLSIGGESSRRNVRSRPALDLESDAFGTHVSANFSQHPTFSRLPIDQASSVDHLNQNLSVTVQEWNPIHVSGTSHGRPIVSSNLTHENNHSFPGRGVSSASGEMVGYHHEHISSGNTVMQSSHPTFSHARGVRSSYAHRSTSNHRTGRNLHMSHVGPSDDSLQQVRESHFSSHPRPLGPVGWHNGDRTGRSMLFSERYRLLSEDSGTHDRLAPEGLLYVEHSSLYGSRNLFDQHREMRLDVDNMSYEELLALGERIGSVSTGLGEDQLPKCIAETVHCYSDQIQEDERCVICLEEYQPMDDVGKLQACGHRYHVGCIKKWLLMKNMCPICKGPALPDEK